MVSRAILERAISDNNVKLTKHEFQVLARMFSDKSQSDVVNYLRMSEDLGLHSKKLNMI